MNLKIFVSSGAFIGRPNQRDHKPFLSVYDKLDADGIEFMMYDSWYDKIDEIVEDFKRSEVNVRTLHADKFIGQKLGLGDKENQRDALLSMEKNCRIAKELGADKIVLHLWNGPISDDNIENNLKAFDSLYDIANGYGITLTPENVVCRNKSPNLYILELAERYPYAKFTFDTKMADFHNELNDACEGDFVKLWKEKRISHLHINDRGGPYKDWDYVRTRHIGEGHIDFPAFFEFLSSVSYDGTLTLECSSLDADGNIHPEKMNESVKKIRDIIKNIKS